MHIGHVDNVKKEEISVEGIEGTRIQWLLAQKENVPHFYMRYVTIEPGGIIPLHSHNYIHEIFIVKGRGAVLSEDGETTIEAGSFIYMPVNEVHGTKNTGSENLELICCINKPPK